MSKMNSTTKKTVSLEQVKETILKHVEKLREWDLINDDAEKTKCVGMWNLLDKLEQL
tara:strand:+ start:38 stop:208 length:171 start_codon:yes stop_codon:yes gene_type:complete